MEKLLYEERVKLKFSPGNHSYYASVVDNEGKWTNKRPQGVTSALKELYPQDSLLEWYSSMASQDIVLALAPEQWKEELQKSFLEVYKGESPVLDDSGFNIGVTKNSLLGLYKIGKEAPLKRSQYGKDVGTQVHEAIDNYHNNTPPSVIVPAEWKDIDYTWVAPSGDPEQDKVAVKSFNAYVKWFVESGLEVTESERMLYSIEHDYAGTVDRIYKRPDGTLILGDFKTSNLSRSCPTGVRESYWSQLGAYMRAYREEFGVTFLDAVIVNSPKNGSLKVVYASDAGFQPEGLESVWLDDLKTFRNHKVMRAAKLRSRVE